MINRQMTNVNIILNIPCPLLDIELFAPGHDYPYQWPLRSKANMKPLHLFLQILWRRAKKALDVHANVLFHQGNIGL